MNNWILLTILYAVFVSLDEVFKKKATKTSSVFEVLLAFTTIALFLTCFISKDIFSIDYSYIPMIFLKSTIIVIAWILGLIALNGLQLGVYSIVKTSRIVFSIILSCLILGEKLNLLMVAGIITIIFGLILVSTTATDNSKKKNSYKLIFVFLISCLCSSISAILDKKLLVHVSSGQLQFWFLLFLTVYYWIIMLIKKKKIDSSKVIVMTILKQLSIIMSIILGGIIFKEKNVLKKLLYALLILGGVIITVIA